eukprot:INCI13347.1.p1 GENE.INCI13347.1~~INCI13347.1.p1  ORF type:complete len:233 (-),score=47.65 INCI13347.1:477-1175(-)
MCRKCLAEVFPDRGSVCLVSGAYLVNFTACNSCKKRDGLPMIIRQDGSALGPGGNLLRGPTQLRPQQSEGAEPVDAAVQEGAESENEDDEDEDSEEDEEEENPELREETEFEHECLHCGHIVAIHFHARICSNADRIDMMDCALCGKGHWKRPPLDMTGVAASFGTSDHGGGGGAVPGSAAGSACSALLSYKTERIVREEGLAAQLFSRCGIDFGEDAEPGSDSDDGGAWSE